MPDVKKMIKTLGVSPSNPMRDSDGDKVVNILDCQPNNKHKQGFIHDIGAKLARKAGKEELAEKIEERGERSDERRAERREERQETRKIAREARVTETRRFSTEKEKIRTDVALERFKKRKQGSGVIKQFSSGFSPPKARRVTKTRTKSRKKKVFEKVGGKFVERKAVSQPRPRARAAPPRKRISLTEHMDSLRF